MKFGGANSLRATSTMTALRVVILEYIFFGSLQDYGKLVL